jgi:hypothetical protein
MRTSEVSNIPQRVNLLLYAGDGVALRLTAINAENGNSLDLAGELTAQIKAKRTDTEPLIEFTINTDQAANGILDLFLTGEQTSELFTDGKQFKGAWDVQWLADGEEPRTLVQGTVICDLDVTRRP